MFWSLLFAIGIAQGGFLVVVFSLRRDGNPIARRLLVAMLVLFVLSNVDDLLLSTGWYRSAPWLFGYSLGALFAYGPLFYLYLRAISDPDFGWRPTTWLHFLPAALNLLASIPFFVISAAFKVRLLDAFVGGQLPVRTADVTLSALQLLHFILYLGLAFGRMRRSATSDLIALRVPLHRRISWLWVLLALFTLIFLSLAALVALNAYRGVYAAGANFVFTIFTSAMLYFIAYQRMINPELLTPDFARKYRGGLDGQTEQDLLARLRYLLEAEKVFMQPDLNLRTLASRLDLMPHRLSMLINDHYGRSFSEVINQYRVSEFIARLHDPAYAALSLYGLALEVGFNSKSAFNAAFKKATGKTPSEFKKQSGA